MRLARRRRTVGEAAEVLRLLRYLLTAVRMALLVVVRWPLRTGLTAFGILVGVAAVTTTVALGDGARQKVSSQIENLGSNAILVESRETAKSGAKGELTSSLSEADAKAISAEVSGVAFVAPLLVSREQMMFEGANTSVEIIGTNADFFPVRSWKPAAGEIWSEQAEKTGERVCLIGQTVREQLFGTSDPVGRIVRLGRYPFRVIGLMTPKGQDPFGRDEDARVMMPISTARSRLRSTRFDEVDVILVSAKSAEASDGVRRGIRALLRERHGLAEGVHNDFRIRTQEEFQEAQERIVGVLNMLLVSIALVSLVVGGVGIMNIMLVSVSERTREIGIRLAIGARERDVLIQFMVESVVLSMLGGVAGALIAAVAVRVLANMLELPMVLSVPTLLVALGVSMGIGVVFGFLPARRAARMDPIDALRAD